MDAVRFRIVRKSAFAGCLLPYRMYINGDFAGVLRNGKTIEARVPRAEKYFLEDIGAWNERNGFFDDDGSDEYAIVIKRAGGWRTDSYQEFYKLADNKTDLLPSYSYDKLLSAIYSADDFSKLRECEKVFARGLEFDNDIRDDMDALLCNGHYHEMLEAVKEIGAKDIYVAVTSFVAGQFSRDTELPFEHSPDSHYYRSAVANGNKMLKNCWENGAYEAFHKCLVCYLTKYIL